MTIPEAIDILRLLAAGINPDTGEVLPEGHLLHEHQVHLSLLTALRNLMATEGSLAVPPGTPDPPAAPSPAAGRTWTQAELDTLRRLYESGISVSDIAQRLHRRPRGVRLQLNLMAGGGPPRNERVEIPDVIQAASISAMAASNRRHGPANRFRPWTAEDEINLELQFSEGKTIPQLAEVFGRSDYAIIKRLQKLGLITDENESAPDRPWSAEDVEVMRRLHLGGSSPSDIAAHLNRREAAIRARLFYMGLIKNAPSLFLAKPEVAPEPTSGAEAAAALPEQVASAIARARRWTAEEDAYLHQAWAEGTLISEMCVSLNLSESQVRFRLVYLGIADHSLINAPPVPPEQAHQGLPWDPEEIRSLHSMFRKGCSAETMAVRLLRPVHEVICGLETLGLTEYPPE